MTPSLYERTGLSEDIFRASSQSIRVRSCHRLQQRAESCSLGGDLSVCVRVLEPSRWATSEAGSMSAQQSNLQDKGNEAW